MTRITARLLCVALALLCGAIPGSAAEGRKPNIVFLLADDLGYGDLGSYGQKKIRTPHIDSLARNGMRFTQHYSGNAVCAPSRCVLMTGRHPGHAIVRNNRELQPEGQFPLPVDTVTLPKLLQRAGYVTGAFGKWGLGGPGSSGDPLNQGFDRFFGYNCQRVAHNYYPTSLWSNAERIPLRNPPFPSKQKLAPDADMNDPETYRQFSGQDYAPDLIAEEALRFIKAQQDKPFFLYFPSTIPHLALQVPEDSLAQYAGEFPETPYDGSRGYLPHRTPRAAYAAMISRLDRDVGAMIALIRELGLEDDTIFIFTSDNGPLFEKFGGTDSDFFESAAHLRGRKGSLYEGGVRVPCVVQWKGRITPGTTSDRVTGFEDWLPTLLELAALRNHPAGIDGISFAPTLLGESQPERPFLYREFPSYGGQQSVRIGDWKAVRQNLARKDATTPKTELYNLAADPSERKDLAAAHPDQVAELEKLMEREHTPSPDFPLPLIDSSR